MTRSGALAAKWTRVAITWLPFADAASADLPLPRLLRLALFQVTIGMATVLLTGTLNRVMIVELGVPAALVALLIAVPLLVAPMRAVIGHRSDNHRSVLGWRRVPYIWFGTLMLFAGLAIMPMALLLLSRPDAFVLGVAASSLAFLLTGAGTHVAQTAGLALATDLAPAEKRPRAVALLYVMLLVGMMIAAVVIGGLLVDFTPTRLVQVIQGAAVVALVLNLVALWKQEPRNAIAPRADEPSVPFAEVWRGFLRETQAGRLLAAIGLGAAAFAMQDPLLEPFGGEVLGLGVGATTGLTGAWAFGALIGFAISARWLVRGNDPLRIAGYGAVTGVAAFLTVLFAAPLGAPGLLAVGAVLIGLGVGLFSVGTMVAAMALAEEGKAGLALGAWGAVQASCAGLAMSLGGLIRDLVTAASMTGGADGLLAARAAGYTTVYLIEIALLLGTLVVLGPLVGRSHRQPPGEDYSRFGLTEFPT